MGDDDSEGTSGLLSGPALVERNAGSGWHRVSVQVPTKRASALSGAACNRPSKCWAVGASSRSVLGPSSVLIERWVGRGAWHPVDVSAPPRGLLESVTCPARLDCWAVGATSAVNGKPSGPLVEHWSGSGWRPAAAPAGSVLLAVACASPTLCWAAGSTLKHHQGRLDGWNGRRWTRSALPPDTPYLTGLSCPSSSECWASEGRARPDRALLWNGLDWTSTGLPPMSGRIQYNSVTCASLDLCVMVGDRSDNRTLKPVVVVWNGSSWSAVGGRSAWVSDKLSGVACQADRCFADGFQSNYPLGRRSRPLLEKGLVV